MPDSVIALLEPTFLSANAKVPPVTVTVSPAIRPDSTGRPMIFADTPPS